MHLCNNTPISVMMLRVLSLLTSSCITTSLKISTNNDGSGSNARVSGESLGSSSLGLVPACAPLLGEGGLDTADFENADFEGGGSSLSRAHINLTSDVRWEAATAPFKYRTTNFIA